MPSARHRLNAKDQVYELPKPVQMTEFADDDSSDEEPVKQLTEQTTDVCVPINWVEAGLVSRRCEEYSQAAMRFKFDHKGLCQMNGYLTEVGSCRASVDLDRSKADILASIKAEVVRMNNQAVEMDQKVLCRSRQLVAGLPDLVDDGIYAGRSPRLLVRAWRTTSETALHDNLGFRARGWGYWIPEVLQNPLVDPKNRLKEHCEGTKCPKIPWISMSDDLVLAHRWARTAIDKKRKGAGEDTWRFSIVRTDALDRLKVYWDRSDKLVHTALGPNAPVRNAEPRHFLAHGWIPQAAVVKTYTFVEFEEVLESLGVREDGSYVIAESPVARLIALWGREQLMQQLADTIQEVKSAHERLKVMMDLLGIKSVQDPAINVPLPEPRQ
ncbi:hypothetical protein BDZ85DRAFT_5272 [Elsinoe ampelina]|uniref:DUF7587 domain-containing protein n=1 Tax=Elsinoe ampelina TaxID=302913 RepID=A0A6A6GPC1_9PEZI|nr:hypothetical protein BDZ85DRAFT_5272 [Elsinoe ampelina]